VSGNRWLVAKMFGVLMVGSTSVKVDIMTPLLTEPSKIFFLLWVLVSG
jgi:hypothetical protein